METIVIILLCIIATPIVLGVLFWGLMFTIALIIACRKGKLVIKKKRGK